MSWILSASGKLPAEAEHLEQEFVDELHALLSRFGMQFAQFQGPTIDRIATGDATAPTASPAPAPETAEAAPPADPAPAPADAKASKAAAKTTAG